LSAKYRLLRVVFIDYLIGVRLTGRSKFLAGYRSLCHYVDVLPSEVVGIVSLIAKESHGLTRAEVEAIVAKYVDAALAPLAAERQANKTQAHRLAALEAECNISL
jgi:hypothetical protein